MIGYFGILIVLRAFTNFCYKFAPCILYLFDFGLARTLRQKLLLPPTLTRHHSNPKALGRFTLVIPTRFETFVIAGFIILNIVLLFVDYPIVTPNVFYSTTRNEYSHFLANRSGIMILSEFVLLVLFASRNNIFISLTGWSLSDFNVFHKWIARTILFNTVVHAAAETINTKATYFYFSAWKDGWLVWGVVAGILMFFASFQAVHFFRSRAYETFLMLHLVLVAVIISAIYYHVKVQVAGIEYVYAIIAIWGFDYLVRFARIFRSGIKSTADVRVAAGDIIEFKISYSGRWKFYPGSYAFIHILLPLHTGWQSHPFSLTTSPLKDDKGKVVILARIKKGVTKTTADWLLDQPDGMFRNLPILLDGPYGDHHKLDHYDTLILVAGGIGITGVYPYASELVENRNRRQRCLFVWTTSDESCLEWFGDQFAYLSSDERIKKHVYLTSERSEIESNDHMIDTVELDEMDYEISPPTARASPVSSSQASSSGAYVKNTFIHHENTIRNHGRPNLQKIVSSEICSSYGSVAFVVCGPGPLNDVVRATIAKNIKQANARIDYYEEAFAW